MDDRFYTLLLLAHRLYQLRRGTIIKEQPEEVNYTTKKYFVSEISFG